MSVLYSYCVLPDGHHPPTTLLGFGHGPVTGLDVGSFTVWSSTESSPPAPDIEGIAKHHEVVVAAAASSAAALPLRFGTWAPDRAALEARIGRMSEALGTAMAATTGKVEMGLRIEGARERLSPAEPPPTDGRGYLRALSLSQALRRSRREHQDSVVALVADRLGALGAHMKVSYLDAPGLVSLAHLISRREEDAYRERVVESIQALGGQERVHVTGPWPPYSFVTI